MGRTLFPALLSGALLLGALGAATAAASTGASPTTRIPAGHGTWSILNYDAQGRRSGILGGSDWRAADWSRLVGAAQKNGPVAAVDTWDMLNLGHADAVQSLRTRARGDWDPGARKGMCPDGRRLAGLAHREGRGLCPTPGLP